GHKRAHLCNHSLDSVPEHIERVPPAYRQRFAIQVVLEAKYLLPQDKVSPFELLDERVDKRLEGLRHQPLAVLIPAEHDHLSLGPFHVGVQIDPKVVAALIVSEWNPQWIRIDWFDAAARRRTHRVRELVIHIHQFSPQALRLEHKREWHEL